MVLCVFRPRHSMSSPNKWPQIIKKHQTLFTEQYVVSVEVKSVVDAFRSMRDSGTLCTQEEYEPWCEVGERASLSPLHLQDRK